MCCSISGIADLRRMRDWISDLFTNFGVEESDKRERVTVSKGCDLIRRRQSTVVKRKRGEGKAVCSRWGRFPSINAMPG